MQGHVKFGFYSAAHDILKSTFYAVNKLISIGREKFIKYIAQLAPKKEGSEVSKKVQYISKAQRAAKFCFVKLYEKLH